MTERRPLRLRNGFIVLGAVVLIVNLAAVAGDLVNQTEVVPGPGGSTFSTLPDGAAGYRELAQEMELEVSQLRQSAIRATLDPESALIVVEPGFWQPEPSELQAIEEFLVRGGRLILAGFVPSETIEDLTGLVVDRSFTGPTYWQVGGENPLIAGVSQVTGPGFGTFRATGGGEVVVGENDNALVVISPVGEGEAVLVADAAVLSNEFIGQADNALLALNLTGGRPVAFYEYVHGYGEGSLFAALPERWRWVLWILGAALLVWMLAVSRRFGPPEAVRRDLAPSRASYVEAMGALLARARQPEAAAVPIRAALERKLLGRTNADLRPAAEAAGLDENEVDALTGSASDPETLLRLDRGLAKVSRGEP